jgi:hypothetical protein
MPADIRFKALRSFFAVETGDYYHRGWSYPAEGLSEATIKEWQLDERIKVFTGPTGIVGGTATEERAT